MYERFTDRARHVMQLANQEALRRNDPEIDTEHILLGLVNEGSGVAANILKDLDIRLRRIRLEIERAAQLGPETISMGRLNLTVRAKKALEFAISEAKGLGHSYVGTEHILLGLLHDQVDTGVLVARQVLMTVGLTLERARRALIELVGTNSQQASAQPADKELPKQEAAGGDQTIKNTEFRFAAPPDDEKALSAFKALLADVRRSMGDVRAVSITFVEPQAEG